MHPNEVREVLDRLRRVETRVTTFMIAQGFDVAVTPPIWNEGTITLPSMGCSLRDILKAVPEGWNVDEAVEVRHLGVPVAHVLLPDGKEE